MTEVLRLGLLAGEECWFPLRGQSEGHGEVPQPARRDIAQPEGAAGAR